MHSDIFSAISGNNTVNRLPPFPLCQYIEKQITDFQDKSYYHPEPLKLLENLEEAFKYSAWPTSSAQRFLLARGTIKSLAISGDIEKLGEFAERLSEHFGAELRKSESWATKSQIMAWAWVLVWRHARDTAKTQQRKKGLYLFAIQKGLKDLTPKDSDNNLLAQALGVRRTQKIDDINTRIWQAADHQNLPAFLHELHSELKEYIDSQRLKKIVIADFVESHLPDKEMIKHGVEQNQKQRLANFYAQSGTNRELLIPLNNEAYWVNFSEDRVILGQSSYERFVKALNLFECLKSPERLEEVATNLWERFGNEKLSHVMALMLSGAFPEYSALKEITKYVENKHSEHHSALILGCLRAGKKHDFQKFLNSFIEKHSLRKALPLLLQTFNKPLLIPVKQQESLAQLTLLVETIKQLPLNETEIAQSFLEVSMTSWRSDEKIIHNDHQNKLLLAEFLNVSPQKAGQVISQLTEVRQRAYSSYSEIEQQVYSALNDPEIRTQKKLLFMMEFQRSTQSFATKEAMNIVVESVLAGEEALADELAAKYPQLLRGSMTHNSTKEQSPLQLLMGSGQVSCMRWAMKQAAYQQLLQQQWQNYCVQSITAGFKEQMQELFMLNQTFLHPDKKLFELWKHCTESQDKKLENAAADIVSYVAQVRQDNSELYCTFENSTAAYNEKISSMKRHHSEEQIPAQPAVILSQSEQPACKAPRAKPTS